MKKSINLIPILLTFLGIFVTISCSDNGEPIEEFTYGRIHIQKIGDVENRYAIYGNNEKVMDTLARNGDPYLALKTETLIEVRNEKTGELVADTLLFPEADNEIALTLFNLTYDSNPTFISPLEGVQPPPEEYTNMRFANLTTYPASKGKTVDIVFLASADFVTFEEIYKIEEIPANSFSKFIAVPSQEKMAADAGPNYSPYSVAMRIYDSETNEQLIPDVFGNPTFYYPFDAGEYLNASYIFEGTIDEYGNSSFQLTTVEILSTPKE